MDRGISSLGGVKPERGSKRLDEYVPPILSEEQAEATFALKPFLKAVGDVNRLAILQELARQDGLSVLDLSDRLVLSQPLTSWHLHILKRARLVSPTHVGRQRIYRLNRDMLEEYRELFNRVMDL
ncbi:MAG TPA: metalloregulator ArsR/SmtB family transcription factor [Chloroflexia bacterium]|nr:metalloregulator ArsR/SmtB family transcription factor [Chloroflexia bacterium]